MRVLGLIVARGGSKGLPGKNLKRLGGHPLVGFAARASIATPGITRTIISTDDASIAQAAVDYGAEAPFLRPPALAGDHSPVLDTVLHALRAVEAHDAPYDAVCLLQPTTPFRTPDDLSAGIDLLSGNEQADSVVSVVEVVDHHPRRLRRVVDGRLVQFLAQGGDREGQQRQDHGEDPAYSRNGAFYLTRRETLLVQASLYGEFVLPYIMPEMRSINIDSRLDFLLAEAAFNAEPTRPVFDAVRNLF